MHCVSVPRQVQMPQVDVRSVAAAWSHTLVLARDGRVFAFGRGPSGQLGLGEQRLECNSPEQLTTLPADVRQVVCTEMTSYARTASGRVYSWGYGGFGTLGHGEEDWVLPDVFTPKRIAALDEFDDVARISAGCRCDAFTREGRWLMWGLVENGHFPGERADAGRTVDLPRPPPIDDVRTLAAIGEMKICASSERLLLSRDGQVLRVEFDKIQYADSEEVLPAEAFVPYLRRLTGLSSLPPVINVADRSDKESIIVTQSGHAYILRFWRSITGHMQEMDELCSSPKAGVWSGYPVAVEPPLRHVERVVCTEHLCIVCTRDGLYSFGFSNDRRLAALGRQGRTRTRPNLPSSAIPENTGAMTQVLYWR
jgi:alpha-tubulin suppressor-like RCC1 family protein